MNAASSGASLNGRRILIVEDEYFIAVRLQNSLEDAGAKVVACLSCLADALAFTAESDFAADVAVIDINLNGELSFPLADRLMSLSVPVVLMSGYDRHLLPPAFQGLPQLQKPASMLQVVAAVQSALSNQL